jgi:hypothetical protein
VQETKRWSGQGVQGHQFQMLGFWNWEGHSLHPTTYGGATKHDLVAIAVDDLVALGLEDTGSHPDCGGVFQIQEVVRTRKDVLLPDVSRVTLL